MLKLLWIGVLEISIIGSFLCTRSSATIETTSIEADAAANQVEQQVDLNSTPNQENSVDTPNLIPVEIEYNGSCEEPLPIFEPQQTELRIDRIRVSCTTIFDNQDEIQLAIQSLPEDSSCSMEQLDEIVKCITELYVRRGYLTSRAQAIGFTDGTLQIRVIEGRLPNENITIENLSGGERLRLENYIRQRILLVVGTPLNVNLLENQLRLLRNDPLFQIVEATLSPNDAQKPGISNLRIQAQEASLFQGSLTADNYSPPSVGSERLGGTVELRNLTGNGDRLFTSYSRSTTGGIELWDFNYLFPVNALDGSLQLRATFDQNRVTDPDFDQFNIEGESQSYELSFRQPLIRTLDEEFSLSLGFSFKDGQTFLFDRNPTRFGIGPDEDGISRTSVLRFRQEYFSRDEQVAWALRSQLSFGIGLFDATTNPHPIPDSRFFSWLAQAQRVQRFGADNLLIVQADLQLTPDSLLPSEQFIIGGGQSLRGYRQNVRAGDNGFRFSVENRITILQDADESDQPVMQLAPFFDVGYVWNHPDNPNPLSDQTFLANVGIGLLWEPLPSINLRLDYAYPLVDLDDRGVNAQDEGFYFSIQFTPGN